MTTITVGATSDVMLVGNSETLTATGSGGVALTNPRWGSDNPSVATVDPATGRVTSVGVGNVTIYVDASGVRGTRLMRIVQNFAGSWSGGYAITNCQSTSEFNEIRFCDNFSPADVLSMSLGLSQNRDTVTGSFTLGSLGGNLTSGTVSGSTLVLTGSIQNQSIQIELQNVRFDSATNGSITGSFEQLWSASGAVGTARLSAEIRSMTRTAGALRLAPAQGRLMSVAEWLSALKH